MKKILLISTFQDGAYAHVVHRVLRKMHYHVYSFDHRNLIFQRGQKYANQLLESYVAAINPDALLAIKGKGLDPKIIEKQPCLKILWWLDNATRFLDFEDYIDVYDKYYIAEEGQGHPWMSIGIDPDLHRPILPTRDIQRCDVVFAGTAHPERSERVIKTFQNLPCETAIWGNSWKTNSHLRGSATYFEGLMQIYTGAKIVLNNHYVKGITPNMRSIEAPASGTLMISDTGNGIEQCLNKGTEYIAYDSIKEARYLIMKYLEEEEEREKIAKEGYRRIHEDHLLKDKLEGMLCLENE